MGISSSFFLNLKLLLLLDCNTCIINAHIIIIHNDHDNFYEEKKNYPPTFLGGGTTGEGDKSKINDIYLNIINTMEKLS